MGCNIFIFMLVALLSTLISALPLTKRVAFNYVWDIANPLPNQQQYQTLVEADFETEMQGVYAMAAVARDFIGNDGAGRQTSTFGFYFGVANQLEALGVRANLDRVAQLPSNNRPLTIRFTDRDSTEWPGAQAYTTNSGTINIYLPRYEAYAQHRHWAPNPLEQVNLERTESRSTVLLHELFHIGGIGQRTNSQGAVVPLADCPYPSGYAETYIQHNGRTIRNSVYGQTAANRLVRQSGFAAARTSAENHALFAFSLWANQFNRAQPPAQDRLPPNANFNNNGSRDIIKTPPRGLLYPPKAITKGLIILLGTLGWWNNNFGKGGGSSS